MKCSLQQKRIFLENVWFGTWSPISCDVKFSVAHFDLPICFLHFSKMKAYSENMLLTKNGACKILHKNSSEQNFGTVNQNAAMTCKR